MTWLLSVKLSVIFPIFLHPHSVHLWLPELFLPSSSSASVLYIILCCFVVSIYHIIIIWKYLLVYLLIQENENMSYMSWSAFPVSPGPTRGYTHCRHSKNCVKWAFIFPVKFFREDTGSDSFLHPPQWPTLCLVWSNTPQIAPGRIKCHFLFLLGWSEETCCQQDPRKQSNVCSIFFTSSKLHCLRAHFKEWP